MASPNECLSMPTCKGVNVEELSIPQLQIHLQQSFTSRDLTESYLKRIELLNPYIKAVIETNPDALSIAETLDKERRNGNIRSKIHGIPFLVKDNIATKDKMQTTAGCGALIGTIVPEDARVVTLLRMAGGILLGKANLSEWASMRATRYAEGYSSRGGQTRNPYNLAEHAGGSSSGSASALAASMCTFSIGTETDGSVMFPADRCGVVGIKPTVGVVSTAGIIPEAPSMDTAGVFGRFVEDAVIVLDVIAEVSVPLSYDKLMEDRTESKDNRGEYVSALSRKDILRGARFGLPKIRIWERVHQNAATDIGCQKLLDFMALLQNAGAMVAETNFPSAEEIIPHQGWDWSFAEGQAHSKMSEVEVVNIEFYHSLRDYLKNLENNKGITSLEDIMSYNVAHADTEGGIPGTHPAWPTGQDGFDNCIKSMKENEANYGEALSYIQRKSREEGIDAALRHDDGHFDALLVPLQADEGVACSVAAKAGYPMITIPIDVGQNGVPFGIGLMQTKGGESDLVRYASAIEDLLASPPRPTYRNLDAQNYPMIGVA